MTNSYSGIPDYEKGVVYGLGKTAQRRAAGTLSRIAVPVEVAIKKK
jgi:hypothetical protein